MIQIVFFMSMITIAALLLNMFWSISDSHEKEYRIIQQIRRRAINHKRHLMNMNGSFSLEKYNYNTGIGTIRSVSNINIDNSCLDNNAQDIIHDRSNVYSFSNRNSLNKGKASGTNRIVRFYDLGVSEYTDTNINSHKNDCA